jgi:RHS repeat-associated protein
VMTIAGKDGHAREYLSYDAWGKRRNPADWTCDSTLTVQFTSRGYTGHEHIDETCLINMNGRVYDPLVGLFISPDPLIQEPFNPLSYNRYSYVQNNPLKFTDPSGYVYRYERIEWERECSTGGGGGLLYFDPYYHEAREYSQWIDNLHSNPDAWSYDSYSQTYWNHQTGVTIDATKYSTGDILNSIDATPEYSGTSKVDAMLSLHPSVTRNVLGTDGLGNQDVLFENTETGALTVVKVPFWEITGSYYNELYYFSGLVAFDTYAALESMNQYKLSAGWLYNNRNRLEEVSLVTGFTTGITGFSSSHTLLHMPRPDVSTNILKGIKIGSKYVGNFTSGVSLGLSVITYRADQTWGNAAKIGVNGLAFGLTFGGPYSAWAGFGISALDAFGAFNGFYNYLNFNQELYNSSGIVITPSLGFYSPIPRIIKLK